MRILDKYLLREFLWPLLYCFDAFALLWLVMDLFDNLGDFIQYHARLGQVFLFFLTTFPEAFVLLMPMSLLLGLLFCLANLGRHNELIAMRAGGISLARMAVPLLSVGALATAVVWLVNERFVPRSRERADAQMNQLRGKGRPDIVDRLFFTNPSEHREWFAQQFNTRRNVLDNVEIHEGNADGSPRRDIYAAQARWQNKSWTFSDVRIEDHGPDTLGGGPVSIAETNFPAIKETPGRLALESKRPEQLTSAELRRTINSLKRVSQTSRLAPYQVTLHYRFALPWTCLVVMWLGLPLGLRVNRSGPLLGVGMALGLVVAFYFLSQFSLALGNGGRIPPIVAAWLMNIVFGGIGTFLFARAR